MASFFELDAFLLDPTSHLDEDSSSFLSFSSFVDLSRPISPFDFSSWTYNSGLKPTKEIRQSASSSSGTSTPSPSDPFQIIETAFENSSTSTDCGIFVSSQAAHATSSKPGPSHQRSSFSGSWESPSTPALSTKASTDSFTSNPSFTPSFSWDEASSSSLGGSSSFPSTPSHTVPLRSVSNPEFASSSRVRAARPVTSMPSLKEEDHMAWLDAGLFTDLGDASLDVSEPSGADQVLVDDFDWVFGDYGLGLGNEQHVPAESTIFAAFQEDTAYHRDPAQQPWISELDPAASSIPQYDFSLIADMPSFTIDPTAIMAPNGGEEMSRPSSAPRLEGPGQMLSVPMGDTMTRSVSSDGFNLPRAAPPRDLFSYAPQQISVGPPIPQPLYTTTDLTHYPRSMPLTPAHTRRMEPALSIQIQQPLYSTYSPLPPTPQSATFGDFSSCQPQPAPMARAGTQPLPRTRKLSGSETTTRGMPAHLVRAQAIVQMQEAKEEAKRKEIRRQAASQRVGMAEASVMQPHYATQPIPQYRPHPPAQHNRAQKITGWSGPSAQTGTLPVLTTAPLVTVHPPPATYMTHQPLPMQHRVHPPPHPGTRPLAKLPTSPSRGRKPSSSPSKRSPAKKRQAAPAGGFSWGEATFINFTSEDAEKLLTGVAPSGSQTKRKREEDALRDPEGLESVSMSEDYERSKRSRSGDDLL